MYGVISEAKKSSNLNFSLTNKVMSVTKCIRPNLIYSAVSRSSPSRYLIMMPVFGMSSSNSYIALSYKYRSMAGGLVSICSDCSFWKALIGTWTLEPNG